MESLGSGGGISSWNSTLFVKLAGDWVSLGETGIKITDESGMDGRVSGKTRKVKTFDNAEEPDTGIEDGEVNEKVNEKYWEATI